MFSKKYAVYKVTTHPFKYEVRRRYNDFLWLRTALVKDYPTLYVPPMADKSQSALDIDNLNKRAQVIQQFMDCLVESEEIRASLHLLCFLKCTDEMQWIKIKEELDKSNKKTAVVNANSPRACDRPSPASCLKAKTRSSWRTSRISVVN